MSEQQSRTDLEQEHRAVLKIPYALSGVVVGLIAQTMTAVWWASGLQVRMDTLQEQVRALQQLVSDGRKDGMSQVDALRMFSSIEHQIRDHEARLRELERKR